MLVQQGSRVISIRVVVNRCLAVSEAYHAKDLDGVMRSQEPARKEPMIASVRLIVTRDDFAIARV